MTINDTSTLTTLLPSTPYTLVYSLPLLFVSLLLTFAGAFLTLDRTRSFPPSYDVLPAPGAFSKQKSKKLTFLLEGGIGGLSIGYAFGLHFATFLSLLIPATSTSAPLSSKSFLAIWLLSCIATTILAGRWRYCALAFSGISGGALISLALAVIIHPALLTRIVLISITTPLLTLLTLLPFPKVQHASLRFASSTTGSFGLIISIALLSKKPILAWANVWERLWLVDSTNTNEQWGTSAEKGLSTGFCLFLVLGIVCDWFLNRRFGECPDQKWDHYLANYASKLPNNGDRAGTFRPFTSVWDRLFSRHEARDGGEIIFPESPDLDHKSPLPTSPSSSPYKLHKSKSSSTPKVEDDVFHMSPGCLKKKGKGKRFRGRPGGRDPVKFKPFGEDDSSSEEEVVAARPWLQKRSTTMSSSTTLNDYEEYDKEKEKIRGQVGVEAIPEYSDFEDDLTDARLRLENKKDGHRGEDWTPGFLQRHQSLRTSNRSSSPTAVGSNELPPLSQGMAAVPATPSLIKALDRIAVAQKDAFGAKSGLPLTSASASESRAPNSDKGPRWDAFWKDVGDKAGSI